MIIDINALRFTKLNGRRQLTCDDRAQNVKVLRCRDRSQQEESMQIHVQTKLERTVVVISFFALDFSMELARCRLSVGGYSALIRSWM